MTKGLDTRVALLICALVLCSQSLAQGLALRPGDIVRNEIFVGQGQARVVIPLPVGDWYVFRAEEQEMRMLNALDQHMAPIRLDIFLAQRVANRIAMTIRIEASKDVLPGRVTSLQVDDPCKRTDTLHRNPYNSSGSVVDCLLVNHIVRYVRTAGTGFFVDFRNWMTKEGIDIPNTVLTATFSQNLPNRFLTVTVTTNPAMRDLDATETIWTASPFHRALISKDAARESYVKEFIFWAEAYKPRIPISQSNQSGTAMAGGAREIPSFR